MSSSSSSPVARGFLVAYVAHDASGAPVPRACLRATYGEDGRDGAAADAALLRVVGEKHFLFPEYAASSLTSVTPRSTMRAEAYTFSLTESDGARTHGFCRRFLPPARRGDGDGVAARYPVVACVLSRHPWFDFFFDALERVGDRVCAFDLANTPILPPDSHVAQFMRSTCARPRAAPGAELVIPLPWADPVSAKPKDCVLSVPDVAEHGRRDDAIVSFAPLLFQAVTSDATIALFAALLHERRVVISGGDLSALSAAVHAAAATTRPLRWTGIFMPTMPASLIDYLTAPMPFLVGLHASHVPAMKTLPTDDIFHLNLDDGAYTYFESDVDSLPTRPTRALRSALEAQMKSVRLDDDAVAGAFRKFIATVLGPYKKHVVADAERRAPRDAVAADGHWLDQEGFENGASTRRTKELLNALRGTQHYEVFVRNALETRSFSRDAGKGAPLRGAGGVLAADPDDVDVDADFDGASYSDRFRDASGSAAAAAARAKKAASKKAAAASAYLSQKFGGSKKNDGLLRRSGSSSDRLGDDDDDDGDGGGGDGRGRSSKSSSSSSSSYKPHAHSRAFVQKSDDREALPMSREATIANATEPTLAERVAAAQSKRHGAASSPSSIASASPPISPSGATAHHSAFAPPPRAPPPPITAAVPPQRAAATAATAVGIPPRPPPASSAFTPSFSPKGSDAGTDPFASSPRAFSPASSAGGSPAAAAASPPSFFANFPAAAASPSPSPSPPAGRQPAPPEVDFFAPSTPTMHAPRREDPGDALAAALGMMDVGNAATPKGADAPLIDLL
ncbi:uncharacterized protein MICPUCDRAFT_39693 [Micromonas pusilla CCMP1545]|uniref:Predicted protein n=1 Tax=Micromonas pusilla (strain CCMP1545) TaxID=564608 RepID=C1MT12_MICPC|nr:uncharacterized protein MICPUCDRAFT_39693 [Micromonas pusilla CCMP1545]EEH57232.1 predicted protein [Micromonas pusilla CCMP1545]|eukprot:XP_003058777.1 predicted protein [Micromonas pusilla CCMP1545]